MNDRDKRLQRMIDFLSDNGGTSPEKLAEIGNVSLMTVYRDVSVLESTGLVKRTRGLIEIAPYALAEASSLMRSGTQVAVKKTLAAEALKLLTPGMSVVLDDSTTCAHLFPQLGELTPMTVITNSQVIAQEVINNTRLELIQLGGMYVRWADAYCGTQAVEMMKTLRPDMCIMSSTAVTCQELAHPDAAMAALKREMLQAARVKVLVVDRTKFVKSALHKFFTLADIDVVITEKGISKELLGQLQQTVKQVILV